MSLIYLKTLYSITCYYVNNFKKKMFSHYYNKIVTIILQMLWQIM